MAAVISRSGKLVFLKASTNLVIPQVIGMLQQAFSFRRCFHCLVSKVKLVVKVKNVHICSYFIWYGLHVTLYWDV